MQFLRTHVRVFYELETVLLVLAVGDYQVDASERVGNGEYRRDAALVDELVEVFRANESLAAARGNLGRYNLAVPFVVAFQVQVEYGSLFGHLLHDYRDLFFGKVGEYLCSVPFVFVTRGAGEDADDLVLDVVTVWQERFQKLHGPERIAHVLYGFQAFDVVEEPPAARKAEQAELLDF